MQYAYIAKIQIYTSFKTQLNYALLYGRKANTDSIAATIKLVFQYDKERVNKFYLAFPIEHFSSSLARANSIISIFFSSIPAVLDGH